MEITNTQKKFDSITYGDEQFDEFLKSLQSDSRHHLTLFLGLYENNKRKALRAATDVTAKEVLTFDFNEIVSKVETDTFQEVDELMDTVSGKDAILYFSNGDKLCGAYTGFSHSKVKYATPQERYFLDKIQAFDGPVIIDITNYDSADETILRAAQSIVKFPLPKSGFQRFLWHLKHYSLHGFEIKTRRPERYLDTSTNI